MYRATIQYAAPNGTFRTVQRWTVGKDQTDALNEIRKLLNQDTLIKWYRITKIEKLEQKDIK